MIGNFLEPIQLAWSLFGTNSMIGNFLEPLEDFLGQIFNILKKNRVVILIAFESIGGHCTGKAGSDAHPGCLLFAEAPSWGFPLRVPQTRPRLFKIFKSFSNFFKIQDIRGLSK